MSGPAILAIDSLTSRRDRYRSILLNGIVPFWLKHGIDREYGGVLTCLRENGELINHDKYLRSQGRAIWTFAAIYNRVEPRAELLGIARQTAEFVLRHCLDENGDTLFRVSRTGERIEGPTSVFTNFGVVYGLSELFRATREERYLAAAHQLFGRAVCAVKQPNLTRLAPSVLPPGLAWMHGAPMITVDVANELFVTRPAPDLEDIITWATGRIMDRHVRPEMKTLVEFLDESSEFVDTPPGRLVIPGHGIESMWFVIRAARRRGDNATIRRAFEVVRWMLESGWDEEFGGIFMARDAKGGEPWNPHWDKKLWWVHCEALYALVLGQEMLGESWCTEWYDRVHDWSFAHFDDPETGEWIQRLDRRGNVTTETIALPVKDPFHWPRAVILMIESFEQQMARRPGT